MTFQQKLVMLRKIKGVNQSELAEAVGVSRQSVYKWEAGQSYPEVTKLIELKAFFNISIDDLLDDNFEITPPEKKRKRRKTEETKAEAEVKTETEKETVTERVTPPEAPAEPIATESTEVKEEPKEEKKEEVKDEPKKRGFFQRLFGG